MKKNIVFFEAKGGSDKGPDGHRRDTMPMVNALKSKGWQAEVIFYSDEKKDDILPYVIKHFDGYVSRINPGNLSGGEECYFDMLRNLSEAGLVGMPHPDVMLNYGAKDALTKLTETGLVPPDTYAYYSLKELKERFPQSLAKSERVLKQNRGSTGEGIWRVSVADSRSFSSAESLPLDAKIKCTEAVDNHVEMRRLDEFMDFCGRYLTGKKGMLVDMPFLPRISEGEIRILLVGETPIFVVHKKPVQSADAFSATLFSGAKYRYDKPEEWSALVENFLSNLPKITRKLGNYPLPLIWTADFMLDTDETGGDQYVLGEMNCSCVGFTSHLNQGIQDVVAEEIIRTVTAARR